MKKASWSLLVILLASLSSLESYAQNRPRPEGPREPRDERPNRPGPQQPAPQPLPQQPIPSFPQYDDRGSRNEEVIEARLQQTIRPGQRLRLSQFLFARDSRAEVVSLTITAQSFQGPAQIQILAGHSIIEQVQVRRQLAQVQTLGGRLGSLDMLELTAMEDIYIESITAHMRSQGGGAGGHIPMPEQQVAPNSLVTLRVNQDIHGSGEIPLKRLLKEQQGLSLEGAEIERIAIEGTPLGYSQASVQVELNNRIIGPARYLTATQRRLPIQVNSIEEVRSLRLLVQGSARIMDINIRIGRVRPVYQPIPQPLPQQSRIFVNQEISPSYPLDLALFAREFAPVRSLTLETTARGRAGEITLMSRQGHIVGRALIAPGRTLILLTIPTPAADIRIFTQSPVHVGSIELELERQIGRR